jgi:hypothetical protein
MYTTALPPENTRLNLLHSSGMHVVNVLTDQASRSEPHSKAIFVI